MCFNIQHIMRLCAQSQRACPDEDVQSRSFPRTNCFPYSCVGGLKMDILSIWPPPTPSCSGFYPCCLLSVCKCGCFCCRLGWREGCESGRGCSTGVRKKRRWRKTNRRATEISTESSPASFDAESVWQFWSMCSAVKWMKSNYSIALMNRGAGL